MSAPKSNISGVISIDLLLSMAVVQLFKKVKNHAESKTAIVTSAEF